MGEGSWRKSFLFIYTFILQQRICLYFIINIITHILSLLFPYTVKIATFFNFSQKNLPHFSLFSKILLHSQIKKKQASPPRPPAAKNITAIYYSVFLRFILSNIDFLFGSHRKFTSASSKAFDSVSLSSSPSNATFR